MSTPDFRSLRERTVTPFDDEGAAERLKLAVLARQARHRTRAVLLLAAAAALVLVGGVGVWQRVSRPSVVAQAPAPSASEAPPPAFGGYVTADGSRVAFLSADTELVQDGAQGRQSSLLRGGAKFDVVHDDAQPFRVVAGPVVVQDVGTVFSVRVLDARSTEVSVEAGRVDVSWSGGSRSMGPGEHEVFTPEVPPAPSATPSASSSTARPPPAADGWKSLAQSGEANKAFGQLQKQGGHVANDGESLLLAADAARLSGHPTEAVRYLKQLLSALPDDPRVGVAAFTLGRLLLDEQGKPSEAADAFGLAYARGGVLAEDALGRQVDACLAAGDPARAKALATTYVSQFPSGRRRDAMKRIATNP